MNFSKNKYVLPLSYEEFCPQIAPIIFLHGMTDVKETWKYCAPYIAQKTGSKVYYYDARNHGCSPWTEGMGLEDKTEDLASFMDMRSIEKAVIVGHSMGGKPAMNFTVKYPKRVSCLILEDVPLKITEEIIQTSLQALQCLKEQVQNLPLDVELPDAKRTIKDWYIINKFGNLGEMDRSQVLLRSQDLPLTKCKNGEFRWKFNIPALENALNNGTLTKHKLEGVYEGPVLMIYGTESPMKVLNEKEFLLKHFPKAMYAPIERGAHRLHELFPRTFDKLVCEFIIKNR